MTASPNIAITRRVPRDFAEVIERIRGTLAAEGFGVLTEIDVQATLKTKLDVDYRRYTILGACNPPLAHRALETDPVVGVVLPCNVVIYEEGEETVIVAFDPEAGFEFVSVPGLEPVAAEAKERIARAVAAV